jgi:hypothetical protein
MERSSHQGNICIKERIILKMNVKEILYEGVNWIPLADSRERGNKQSIFLKGGKFLKNLNDWMG